MQRVQNILKNADTRWEARLSDLKLFVCHEGRPPAKNASDLFEASLYAWVHNQVRLVRQSKLSSKHVETLANVYTALRKSVSVNTVLVSTWKERSSRFEIFVNTYRRLPDWRCGDPDEVDLAVWLYRHVIMSNSFDGQLSERDAKLCAIHVLVAEHIHMWRESTARRFQLQVEALVEFMDHTGGFQKRSKARQSASPLDLILYKWVRRTLQRGNIDQRKALFSSHVLMRDWMIRTGDASELEGLPG